MPTTNLDYDELDQYYFPLMADRLLNECYLLVNDVKYRLVEIEFYLKSANHNDQYVHGAEDQMLMHTYYFHKFKNGTYRNGTFRGMDLTFGSEKDEAYFAVLIRAIQNMETGIITEGPCNTVNKILSEYGCNSINDFTDGNNLDIFDNNHNFLLVPTNNLEPETIYCGPRIGLSEKYPEFQKRNYRFLIHKNQIKKCKSGLVEV